METRDLGRIVARTKGWYIRTLKACVTGDESWRFRYKEMLHVTFKGVVDSLASVKPVSQGLDKDMEA